MDRRHLLNQIGLVAGSLLFAGCQFRSVLPLKRKAMNNKMLTVDGTTLEKFRQDLHRPTYHFLPPKNWMNDPNGLIQWKGIYHLFYQHNPFEAKWGPMYWGHATSKDLVHWEHRPIAMAPTPGSPDEDGCWSGCAVNWNDIPAIIYSGNRAGQQRCCLAFSNDDLQTLEKYESNPVIPETPPGFDIYQYRDHCVWHDGKQWNQLIGAGVIDQGGLIFLYRSSDLQHWELVGPILSGDIDRNNPLWSGRMWECPDLIPLGHKHMLVISVYAPEDISGYTGYFLGTYADGIFIPESFQKMDLGDREFYAPQSFVNQAVERIQFGWLPEARREDACIEAGWAGVMSLPRYLSLRPDGRVRIIPHPSIELLRGRGETCNLKQVTSTTQDTGILGRSLELHMVISADSSARRCGLKILATPDYAEETLIAFEPSTRRISVDRLHSSLDGRCAFDTKGGEIRLEKSEDLDLRIFLDHSVLEIFINEQETLSCRVYPTAANASAICLFAEDGTCDVKRLDYWEMLPMA